MAAALNWGRRRVEQALLAAEGEPASAVLPGWQMVYITKVAIRKGQHYLSGEQIAKLAGIADRHSLSAFLRRHAGCTLSALRGFGFELLA